MSPTAFTVLVSFVTDFIIAAGGTLTGGIVGQREVAPPSLGVWILAVIVGLTAAARRVQALLSPSVVPPPSIPTAVVVVETPKGMP